MNSVENLETYTSPGPSPARGMKGVRMCTPLKVF